jgi:Tfp pilus assembly protein PilO
MKAQRRTQLWTVAIAAAAMVFVATVAARQFRQLRGIQDELKTIHRAMDARDSAAQELARLEHDIARLESLVNRSGNGIPPKAELGEFLQELTRRVGECGVVSSEIRPGEPAIVDRVNVRPVTFRVQGSGRAIFDLIQGIESMTRMTRFEHVAARPAQDQEGQVDAEVCVSVFFREL